jgi:two-component system, sensor histidine kinase and response regulator
MTILIVEDEPAIRETLQLCLELNGHTVLAAADGPTGVRLAAELPDMILCDVGLPGLDGYGVLTAIRQLPAGRDVPFIFLTARVDRQDQRRGMALGADDYVTKPFTQRDIIDAINARVRRQQPLRERVGALLSERRTQIGAKWSHELMTPLAGIQGGLQLIEAEADTIQPAELRELLALIRLGAARQLVLARKLVCYFELEQLKSAPPDPRRCDAPAGIEAGVASAVQTGGRARDISIRCEPGTVPVSLPHLLAAVAEMVDNALRFSVAGQPVAVSGSAHAAGYRIEVRDEGAGMTPEQCAHIGPFVQFDRDKREQQGLGLGLAIARSVAELAGGSFRLAPGPGNRGLLATLELPLA